MVASTTSQLTKGNRPRRIVFDRDATHAVNRQTNEAVQAQSSQRFTRLLDDGRLSEAILSPAKLGFQALDVSLHTITFFGHPDQSFHFEDVPFRRFEFLVRDSPDGRFQFATPVEQLPQPTLGSFELAVERISLANQPP